MHREAELTELVERLRTAAGTNLHAVVLYGSAAGEEFSEGHSDLNILCLLNGIGGEFLANLRPIGVWWRRKGHPALLVFTLNELHEAADVFAIELLDMKHRHRILLGDDFLADFDVPMAMHRSQVERELRAAVIRLRRAFLSSKGSHAELSELMVASSSTFAALFRHSLIVLGEDPPDSRREIADRVAAVLGEDAAAFHAVLDLREGKRHAGDANPEQRFAAYLAFVTRVGEEVSRRLDKA